MTHCVQFLHNTSKLRSKSSWSELFVCSCLDGRFENSKVERFISLFACSIDMNDGFGCFVPNWHSHLVVNPFGWPPVAPKVHHLSHEMVSSLNAWGWLCSSVAVLLLVCSSPSLAADTKGLGRRQHVQATAHAQRAKATSRVRTKDSPWLSYLYCEHEPTKGLDHLIEMRTPKSILASPHIWRKKLENGVST